MGASLRLYRALLLVLLYQISFLQVTHAQDKAEKNESKLIRAPEYYQYWNPYRRVLSQRGEVHTFIGKVYYEVNYNKDDRIKSVTKFGKDGQARETYRFLWSRSGIRSEYKVEFHTDGRASRLSLIHI